MSPDRHPPGDHSAAPAPDDQAAPPLASTGAATDEAGGDAGLDLLDEGLPPSGQPGRSRGRRPRGPLIVHVEITWVHGPGAEALRKTQGRALRALLSTLARQAASPTAGSPDTS